MKRGRTYADGLRDAVEIIRAVEEPMIARLEASGGKGKTNDIRRVRIKAYQVARTRITTRLKAVDRPAAGGGIVSVIEKLGL